MIGAALLAKNAVDRGLTRNAVGEDHPGPGSKVVTDYYERAGLTPYLEKLGFNLVGYGCTTCIGNSGPLIPEVSQAVNDSDLAVAAVLSGNRNFEGRINADIKMNYLASPPLVVAYALAGSMDLDLLNDPLGQDTDGKDVFLHDIWPSPPSRGDRRHAITAEMFAKGLLRRLRRRRALAEPSDARGRHVRLGRRLDVRPQAAVLRRHACRAVPVEDISRAPGARQARRLGHHGPHLTSRAIKKDSPAGTYLAEHGVEPRDFNSYGSRRGNHEVMIRGTFANIRLRNQLAPGTEGGFTATSRRGRSTAGPGVTTIYDASVRTPRPARRW
jgi:aconitate hydratase